MNLLTMEHVSKAYTDRVLLDDVGFGINKNEKIGVIGVNGMGKSTLLKIVAGIEESDAGTISMGNQVKICYLPQTPEFEEGTTVLRAAIADNVNELNQWTIEADARSMLNQLGFYDYDEKVEHMSGGQKKRIALVNALLTPADILILDEPTSGLDPGERMRFRNLLSEFGRNRIVLISTHIVSDVEYIATCNAIMKDGKIAAVGETEELVKEVEGKVWNAVLDMAEAMTYETKVPVVNIYNREDGKTVLRYLAERPVISGSEPADARMEDLYLWMFPEQGKEEVR